MVSALYGSSLGNREPADVTATKGSRAVQAVSDPTICCEMGGAETSVGRCGGCGGPTRDGGGQDNGGGGQENGGSGQERTAAAVRRTAVAVRRTSAAVRRAAIAGQSGANGHCGESIRHGSDRGGVSNVLENVGMACHLRRRFVVGGCEVVVNGGWQAAEKQRDTQTNPEILNPKIRQLAVDVGDGYGG
jgi:hypothetical protein